ncbi:MAG: 50S ribosomal protein L37ae [Halobacteriales archaeon]
MPDKRRRTGSSGRFGPRYGRVARRRVSEIEEAMREPHTCPDCGADRVARTDTGIWRCSRCDHTFTGGAYRPETPGGRTVKRSIRAALAGEEVDLEFDREDEAEPAE